MFLPVRKLKGQIVNHSSDNLRGGSLLTKKGAAADWKQFLSTFWHVWKDFKHDVCSIASTTLTQGPPTKPQKSAR